ncbi:MAG: winged helix-turn-helix domain-containing protein, partial [bacterium]|nr:winged helix-turn-helix domain-containing protein [bacterium]
RRIINRFLIENVSLFPTALPDHNRYLLVYVEPLELTEETPAGYLRLVGKKVIEALKENKHDNLFEKNFEEDFESETVNYPRLLTTLTALLRKTIDSGLNVVLFLGEFDELSFVDTMFCNNLRFLWGRFDDKLHYVFLIKEVKMIFEKDRVGEDLGENFLKNVIYTPISPLYSDYLITGFEKKMNHKFSAEERQTIKDVCDGHSYFLKIGCSLVAGNGKTKKMTVKELTELLRKNHELRAVAKRILEVQTNEGKEMLRKMIAQKVDTLGSEEAKSLEYLGLVYKDKGGCYHPFCQLFEDIISEKTVADFVVKGDKEELGFDAKSNTLLLRGIPAEEKFTPQEYEVLRFLLKEPNKLRSRDEIGDAIWGKDAYDRYSDWAIDQLISKLRKKLLKLGVKKSSLVTVRGRGYKITREV